MDEPVTNFWVTPTRPADEPGYPERQDYEYERHGVLQRVSGL